MKIKLGLMASAMLLAGAVQSRPLAIEFEGVVQGGDLGPAVGETVRGRFAYDSETQGVSAAGSNTLDYLLDAFELDLGAWDKVHAQHALYRIWNSPIEPVVDEVTVEGLNLAHDNDKYEFGSMQLDLRGTPQGVFSAYPKGLPTTKDFALLTLPSEGRLVAGIRGDSSSHALQFKVTSLTMVPEPPALGLASVGLLVTAWARKQRARSGRAAFQSAPSTTI